MSYISVADASAWTEPSKLTIGTIEPKLEEHAAELIINRVSGTFNTSQWADTSSTPKLIRTLIAMEYVAWLYDRTYSDLNEGSTYAALLRQTIDSNIAGILAGSITMDDATSISPRGPSFYPTDLSSSQEPTYDDPSLGGPAFMMGSVF